MSILFMSFFVWFVTENTVPPCIGVITKGSLGNCLDLREYFMLNNAQDTI